jgi:hypothetical protein
VNLERLVWRPGIEGRGRARFWCGLKLNWRKGTCQGVSFGRRQGGVERILPFWSRLFLFFAEKWAGAGAGWYVVVHMRALLLLFALLVALMGGAVGYGQGTSRIVVTVPAAVFPVGAKAVTGHLLVVFAKQSTPDEEPRDQVQEQYTSAQAFGVDVTDLKPGGTVTVDAGTAGYPLRKLSEVPTGTYFVQAVLNVYEPFRLASGKTVLLPPDKGEGQHWGRKPGNPYDVPQRVDWMAGSEQTLALKLDRTVPPVATWEQLLAKDPGAKPYLKYVHMRSAKLSAFWGRDMYLDAWVLLPPGFAEHPGAHYPTVVYQDHFSPYFGLAFRTTPPAADAQAIAKGRVESRELAREREGYQFFEDWTNGRMPHVLVVSIQNANPYYDDSYVMDSANVGPYGSAVTEELIPKIEKEYRGIGEGWARATFGGSTGGWEALASQVFYPDFYNGTWASCPDPVDFHAYQNVDLYTDTNAFVRHGDFGSELIAADRKADGSVLATTGDEVQFEYVLGTQGRSGEQWNIWQAVYSPQGPDGLPVPIWDDQTGVIDKKTVQYWHDHWDLTAVMQRDWPTLGPKLEGKIHVQAGEGDTYFLNNAVHRMQTMLDGTRNPHSDASFQYGAGDPHCYTGGPDAYTMAENNRNWPQRVLPQMVKRMKATAPQGADVSSWVY